MSKTLDKFEKELAKSYLDLSKEVMVKTQSSLEKLKKAQETGDPDKIKTAYNNLLRDKSLMDQTTDAITNVNREATNYINDMMNEVYAENWNYEKYRLESELGQGDMFPLLNKGAINSIVAKEATPFTKLALNHLKAKTGVKNELTRILKNAMALGESNQKIASRISKVVQKNYNQSIRIARTESTRVQAVARNDVGKYGAEELGLIQTKEWVATKGGRTRDAHRDLDGQVVGYDEYFKVDGKKALYPGDFGRAELDINCRCTFIIDIDYDAMEVDKPKGDDKPLDFDEWQKAGEPQVKVAAPIVIKDSDLPSAFTTSKEIKQTKLQLDYMNNNLPDDYDRDVFNLYTNMGKLKDLSSTNVGLDIKHGKNDFQLVTYRNSWTGELAKYDLKIPNITKANVNSRIHTILHEQMHLIDGYARDINSSKNVMFSRSFTKLNAQFNDVDLTIGDETLAIFEKFKKDSEAYEKIRLKQYEQAISETKRENYKDWKAYNRAWDKHYADYLADVNDFNRKDGVPGLMDIYDALSGGEHRDSVLLKYGHGSEYYKNKEKRPSEAIANYASLSLTRPDLIDVLKRDKPDLVEALDAAVKEINKLVV